MSRKAVRSATDEQNELEALHRLDEECVYQQQAGNYLQAFDCMERALVLRQHFFGAESPEVAHACRALAELCNLLAMSFLQQDNFAVTIELLRKAEVLSQHHARERATTLNNLACYYRRLGQLHAALTSLTRALAIERRLHDVRNAADTHLNVCAVLSQLGKHDQALAHAMDALAILETEWTAAKQMQQQTPGTTNSPQLDRVSVMCIAYHNIGVEHEFLKDYVNSVGSYKKGVGLAEQYLGVDHAITTTVRNSYLAAKRTMATKPLANRSRSSGGGSAIAAALESSVKSPSKAPVRLIASPRSSGRTNALKLPSPLATTKDRMHADVPSPRSIVADALARGATLPPLDSSLAATKRSGLSPRDAFFSPRFRFGGDSDGRSVVDRTQSSTADKPSAKKSQAKKAVTFQDEPTGASPLSNNVVSSAAATESDALGAARRVSIASDATLGSDSKGVGLTSNAAASGSASAVDDSVADGSVVDDSVVLADSVVNDTVANDTVANDLVVLDALTAVATHASEAEPTVDGDERTAAVTVDSVDGDDCSVAPPAHMAVALHSAAFSSSDSVDTVASTATEANTVELLDVVDSAAMDDATAADLLEQPPQSVLGASVDESAADALSDRVGTDQAPEVEDAVATDTHAVTVSADPDPIDRDAAVEWRDAEASIAADDSDLDLFDEHEPVVTTAPSSSCDEDVTSATDAQSTATASEISGDNEPTVASFDGDTFSSDAEVNDSVDCSQSDVEAVGVNGDQPQFEAADADTRAATVEYVDAVSDALETETVAYDAEVEPIAAATARDDDDDAAAAHEVEHDTVSAGEYALAATASYDAAPESNDAVAAANDGDAAHDDDGDSSLELSPSAEYDDSVRYERVDVDARAHNDDVDNSVFEHSVSPDVEYDASDAFEYANGVIDNTGSYDYAVGSELLSADAAPALSYTEDFAVALACDGDASGTMDMKAAVYDDGASDTFDVEAAPSDVYANDNGDDAYAQHWAAEEYDADDAVGAIDTDTSAATLSPEDPVNEYAAAPS